MSRMMLDHPDLLIFAIVLAAVILAPWGHIAAWFGRNPEKMRETVKKPCGPSHPC